MTDGTGTIPIRRWRVRLPNTSRRPRLEAVVLVCFAAIVSALILAQSYRQALDEARATTSNLTALLGEHTRIAMRSTDAALMSMVTVLESAQPREGDANYASYLDQLNDHLDYVRTLFVVGTDGYAIHTTQPDALRVSLADRRYFQILRDDPEVDLFVGRPVQSMINSEWFVPVARRIETADGGFAGIAVAAVEPSFVERTFQLLQLREFDTIALLHKDSTLIASVPPLPGYYRTQLTDHELFRSRLPHASSGVYTSISGIHQRSAIVGYAALEDFPLIVGVSLDRTQALASWRQMVPVVVLGAILIVVLTLFLRMAMVRRTLEQQVARQEALMHEKVQTIGFMTSSVAHDFKNLLAVVRSGTRMLRRQNADETLLAALDDAADRGIALTTDLLNFAKDHELRAVQVQPDRLIERLSSLLQRTTGPGVELHLDLDAANAVVEVSLAQFDSTLVNLCINASHAMPEGGLLRIATLRVPLRGHETLRDGDYVEISVEDTGIGIGIPEEIQKGLFAPFASTKGRDGSGMGLFQARRFAEDAGGAITLSSTVGKGTRVIILLPLVKGMGRGRAAGTQDATS
ncbi:hybrid sensor histidine kinase/response regulator [Citreimonas salinaria]|uniref:histidine kinase n=1 Tax=Citreimonas salinaria TaxID=321339 RepID=A0A1H3NB49_9RHOB|nr:hybrid sensor histidine kinase/response regulator [Citreimonas salinaria]SDY86068.1 Signal transduction histidine kinase [Citreimonas salinaria]